MLKKVFLLLALIVFGIDAYAGTIIFKNNGKDDDIIRLEQVTIKWFNSVNMTVAYKGTTHKIPMEWLISYKNTEPIKQSRPPVLPKTTVPPAPTNKKHLKTASTTIEQNFPTELAAYILHARYLFGAGQSDQWYYGREVTVSGVVDVTMIKKVDMGDLVDPDFAGMYEVPMMNGYITCITAKNPISQRKKKTRTGGRYRVMKFKGIVKKSSRYKEAFIYNAELISSRSVCKSRRCRKSRFKAKSSDKRVVRREFLATSCHLAHSGYLEQHSVSRIGRIDCLMGNDPEAYAMELHWAKKLYKLRGLQVRIVGLSDSKSERTRLVNCQVLCWFPLKK